jgi:formylglycine-generating enzyme required for sulfatase activity
MFIPAGQFMMGAEGGDPDEKPIHSVTLVAFWMDKFEVSSEQYEKCVDAGQCESLTSGPSWEDATNYCGWAGARLPTEAEWERAARGDLEGKLFPWGDQIECVEGYLYPGLGSSYWVNTATGQVLKHNQIVCRTSPATWTMIHSTPNAFDLFDMVGGVWEWVSDWYGETFYAVSPSENPTGPGDGVLRVLRGGSDNLEFTSDLRVANRGKDAPNSHNSSYGFRCAMPITP